MKAKLSEQHQNMQPWDFKPLRGFKKFLAYLSYIPLLLLTLSVLMLAIIFSTVLFDFPISGETVLEKLGFFGLSLVLWLVIASVSFPFIWAFVVLKKKICLLRYEKRCKDNAVYVVSGSLFRSFNNVGAISFSENSLKIKAMLGPNLLTALLILVVIELIAFIIVLQGVKGALIGSFGAILIIAIYNAAFKHEYEITVEPDNIRGVKCRGPIFKVGFFRSPVPLLKRVTLFLPSSYAPSFLGEFNTRFPKKLPPEYQEALEDYSVSNH